ncbi:hypothetical protein D082_31040 [Synechocystis sp. PCC 6714]|nr:hypothetical protein D082_31040 [Synechocystis sp. PCC 6714]
MGSLTEYLGHWRANQLQCLIPAKIPAMGGRSVCQNTRLLCPDRP